MTESTHATPANPDAPEEGWDAPSGVEPSFASSLLVRREEPGYGHAGPHGLLARLGAEAFGSALIVLLALGTALYATFNSGVTGLGLALALALGYIAAAASVGHVSGGHFNPVLSLGATLTGRLRWADLVPYWIAQVAGGAAAAGALFLTVPSGLPALFAQDGTARLFFSSVANGFGENSPTYLMIASQVGADAAAAASFALPAVALVEGLVAAALVAVFLLSSSRARPATGRAWAPVAVGLAYAGLAMVTVPLTNGAVNPARATAAALFSDSWAMGQLWLFWVAPLLGAALAGVVVSLTLGSERAEEAWATEDWDEGAWDEGADRDGLGDDAVGDADALADSRDLDATAVILTDEDAFDLDSRRGAGSEPVTGDVRAVLLDDEEALPASESSGSEVGREGHHGDEDGRSPEERGVERP